MIKNGWKGTIKVFGCPAEEGGSGKVYMVSEGLFNGVDIVLHWHPGDENRDGWMVRWPINQPNSGSMAFQPMQPLHLKEAGLPLMQLKP